jgi:apolipoprotein N-acyltransferase
MMLFNPASHAVFHNSSILKRQMEAVNRTRAIELDRYIVVAGNMTDSLVISNQGEVVARFEPVYPARLDLTVAQANTRRTPFARTGEWIVYLALFIVGGAVVVSLQGRKET